jgi:hypothetical protein
MAMSCPNNGCTACAELWQGGDGAFNVVVRNVSKNAADKYEICGDHPDVRVRHRRIAGDDLDAVGFRVSRERAGYPRICRVEFDQATFHASAGRVGRKNFQEIASRASADADNPDFRSLSAIEKGADPLLNHAQALAERVFRILVLSMPVGPIRLANHWVIRIK